MSRGAASVIVLFLILVLTALFFFSPNLFPGQDVGNTSLVKELTTQRLTSLGKSIAHAAFVEDAVIMGDDAKLSEIITRLQKDEPELTFVHITDAKYNILASSDTSKIGAVYSTDLLPTGSSSVKEQNGFYEAGFSINVGQMRIGALYFGLKPNLAAMPISKDRNPLIIIAGFACALIAFLVMLFSKRRTKARLVAEMNTRQEEIFSPKIEALRRAQNEAQSRLNEINDNIKNAEQDLQRLSDDYETRRKEAESDPLMQSVEKLKSAEIKLMKHLEELKEEESQLNTELSLLSQKREEVLNALENEKKEERTLHEKLDLIKKKILHLETPGK
jgi:sensor histidine kinase regulating citrate/malate metabolism